MFKDVSPGVRAAISAATDIATEVVPDSTTGMDTVALPSLRADGHGMPDMDFDLLQAAGANDSELMAELTQRPADFIPRDSSLAGVTDWSRVAELLHEEAGREQVAERINENKIPTRDQFEFQADFVRARREYEYNVGAVTLHREHGCVLNLTQGDEFQLLEQREKNGIYRSSTNGDFMKVGNPDVVIDTASAFESMRGAFNVVVPEIRSVLIDESLPIAQRGALVMSSVESSFPGILLQRDQRALYEVIKENIIRPIQDYLKDSGYFEELSDQNWGITGEDVLHRFSEGLMPTEADITIWDPVY